ncbi:MAG: hypothetical protein JWM14_1754 [Chitinophagaceae bacterium]|nr:hypothetical protein [Chitinophagaceae bacterium]
MKKLLLSFLLLFVTHFGFADGYLIKWNETNSNYEIQSVNLSTGAVTNLGVSTAITSIYDLDEIYYDKNNLRLVALYQSQDLWTFDLTNHTDAVIELGSDNYRDLFVGVENSYLILWNETNTNYEIKSLNLNSYTITPLGTSTTLSSIYDLDEVAYDELNNQLVSLYQTEDLWTFNLTTNTDAIKDLGSLLYRNFTVNYTSGYLIYWNETNNYYEIKEIDLASGTITSLGVSSVMGSYYDLYHVYYDPANNQLVGLFQDTDLWKYNLSNNTDAVAEIGTDPYRSLAVPYTEYVTGIQNPTDENPDTNLEIVKVFDITGKEMNAIESNTPAIVVYKNGARRKIMKVN